MRLYSIYDTKAESWGNPVSIRTDAEAIRMFKVVANDDQSEIGKHPEDFMLFRVGTFNNETGSVEGLAGTCIAKALELKENK